MFLIHPCQGEGMFPLEGQCHRHVFDELLLDLGAIRRPDIFYVFKEIDGR